MNSLSLFSKVYRFRLTIRAHGFSPARRLPNLRQCPCRRFFAGSVRIPIRRRQDLTESAGNAFSVVHGALQEQPLGSHEQRALLLDTGSRAGQRRQGAAPPRGADRLVLARIVQADPQRVQERTSRRKRRQRAILRDRHARPDQRTVDYWPQNWTSKVQLRFCVTELVQQNRQSLSWVHRF